MVIIEVKWFQEKIFGIYIYIFLYINLILYDNVCRLEKKQLETIYYSNTGILGFIFYKLQATGTDLYYITLKLYATACIKSVEILLPHCI